jgi:hypothetical protein
MTCDLHFQRGYGNMRISERVFFVTGKCNYLVSEEYELTQSHQGVVRGSEKPR